MALTARLTELHERHRILKRKLEEEMARPGSSDLELARLKREKLKLKDEIASLEADKPRRVGR